MATKKNKPLDEELIERAARSHGKRIGEQVIDREIDSSISEFEASTHVGGLKGALQAEISTYNLNLHSTIFFLISLQLGITFLLLLLLDIFAILVTLILVFIVMFVGVVYCATYCLLTRYPDRFKKSSSSFVICIVLAVSEGILLCLISEPISTEAFLLVVVMLIGGIFADCVYAKAKKENYTMRAGIAVCESVSLLMYVLFMIAFEDSRIWLSLCTIAVCAYEVFLVSQVSKVVRKIEMELGEDTFQAGIYASLLIFKAKIDFFFNLAVWAYQKCCKPKEPEQSTDINME